MKYATHAILLSTYFGLSRGQRDIGVDCYGEKFPHWDDCKEVVEYFKFRDNLDEVAYNGQDGPEPSCTWWYWKDGNCRISACFTVTNQHAHDHGGPERLGVDGNSIANVYDAIRGNCEKLHAGGSTAFGKVAEDDYQSWGYYEVTNDPDQSPPSAKTNFRSTPHPDRMIKETVSLQEYKDWKQSVEAKRAVSIHDHIFSKREDDDTEWYINNSGKNVRQEGVYDVGPRASNGIETEYSTTNSKSFTSTTSANIGAAFEMFSAGIGFEESQTTEFSITKGLKFTPNCKGNQKGQAYFYPFFDYYDVTFSPSQQRVDVWIPVPDSEKFIKGDIEVECIG